jgi:hypothetical protein
MAARPLLCGRQGMTHVSELRIGLQSGMPVFLSELRPKDEFSINDVVATLCAIAPGGMASKLRGH